MKKKILPFAISLTLMLLLSMAATGSAIEPAPDPFFDKYKPSYPLVEKHVPTTSPSQVHLTWRTNDTAHTMTVTWRTSAADTGDIVKYDTVSRRGVVADYAYEATGTHHTFGAYAGFKGWIHDVELTGLKPDTTYYFICGGPGGWSREWNFRTAPITSKDVKFVAGGDSRPPYAGGGEIKSHPERRSNFPLGRDYVSKQAAAQDPDFIIYNGDYVDTGDCPEEWDSWMNMMQDYWVTKDNRMIPAVHVIGNHELAKRHIRKLYEENRPENVDWDFDAFFFYEQFALPGNEFHYSLDWGPDVHITVLGTTDGVWIDPPYMEKHAPDTQVINQVEWLRADLAANAGKKWKIVAFHVPPYSSGSHGCYEVVQTHWVPIFEEYGVDLVLSAHDHDYERSYPIKAGKRASSTEEGAVYVVNGCWGAPLYHIEKTNWWTAFSYDEKHCLSVAEISAAKETMTLKTVDTKGILLDKSTHPYYLMAAMFTVENLKITPPSPEPEEPVYIFADIANTGELPGSLDVPLVINGVTVDTVRVTLDPGKTETVSFTVKKDVGSYAVGVYGATGGFGVAPREVALAPTAVWVAIVITIAVICILGTTWIVGRKR